MKISNEAKIGILGATVIVLMIIGFNFLKGKKIFSRSTTLYARYGNIQGLSNSNPVYINGMLVGNVSDISNDKSMKELLVSVSLFKDINIPVNSIAIIKPNPLSITQMDIQLGDAPTYLKDGDTLITKNSEGFIEGIVNTKVDPILLSINHSIQSIDSLLQNARGLFDDNNKRNIAQSLEHINHLTASIENLTGDKGPLTQSLRNTEKFTSNLAATHDKVDSILDNLSNTSSKLSKLDLQRVLGSIEASVNNLKSTLEKVNSKEGSAGLLLNDPALYKNLTSTSNKLNILLDDIRVHPGRYISVSVFGKKQKDAPLQAALTDSTKAP